LSHFLFLKKKTEVAMSGRKFLLILACLVFLPSILTSQAQEWVKFEATWINDIAVEGRYVWIGTSGYGLGRLDTVTGQVTWYNTRSNPRLPDDWVYAIAIDDSGNKWLGLGSYFAKFDGNRFISVYSGNPVTAVAVDDSGYVWTGTSRGSITRYDRRNFPPRSSCGSGRTGRVNKILFDDSMNVYVAYEDSRDFYKLVWDSTEFCGFKLVTAFSFGLSDWLVTANYDRKRKVFWISSFDGMYKWDKVNPPQSVAIPSVYFYDVKRPGFWWYHTLYSISIDTLSGKVWFAFSNHALGSGYYPYGTFDLGVEVTMYPGGVFSFDGSSWAGYRPNNSPLPNADAKVVYVDNKTGNVWVGLRGAVAVFNGSNWKVYYIPENNIASGWVSSIAVDKFGNKWFGTIDGGLRKFDGTTWTIYTPYNSGLPDFPITAVGINPVNNDIWVGINNRGVGRLSNGQWTLYDTINSPLKSTRITGFTFDKSGNVWIATRPAGREASPYPYPSEAFYGGVYKFDGTNFTWYYTKNSPLPSEGVQSITTDKNGNIWLGTAYRDFTTSSVPLTGGVVKISGNSWAVYDTSNGFPSIWTWRVAVDDSGNTWIGTYGKGLVKFDGQNTTVYNRSNSGLPGDTVYSIAIDASGVIWATTNKGVVKFDRNQWSVFNSSNTGMPIDQAKFVMIDKQGNKWFLSGWWGDRVVVYREGGVILDVEQVADVIPSSFKLYQNYPNPFNPMTTIEFEIPERANVKLIVYDILGREVGKLVDKELEPGRYKVNFEAGELSSGVYFYRLEAGKFADVKKMLLVK